MHNCEEVLQHVYEYIQSVDISPEISARVKEHLVICRQCYSRVEFEQKLMVRFKSASECSCPDSLKQKIQSLLDSF